MARATFSTDGVPTVRLADGEQHAILQAVQAVAHALGFSWREISLFGSRTNPAARGGDIDLYVGIEPAVGIDLIQIRQQLKIELDDRIGEQKIDIVIDDGRDDLAAFRTVIQKTKVELWKTN